MKRKKICIVTGSRAEWGLFYPLACEIKSRGLLDLSILATGAHMSSRYGKTVDEIKNDGFKVDGTVTIPLEDDTREGIAAFVGEGIKSSVKEFRKVSPDVVFLLGDRFEIFSAAVTCTFLGIPLAHIHGGELTEGSLDDKMRHMITKLSALHFVANEDYRRRVIQLGEHPSTVFNVGALGIDNIKKTRLLEKSDITERTGIKFGKKNILVTFNPSTAEDDDVSRRQLEGLLGALDRLEDAKVIFTMPNPDAFSRTIAAIIDGYVAKNPSRSAAYRSLGRLLYLSLLQYVDAVAGNSSSGIIEVPSFGIPTVNVGDRQKGRIRALSVIDAGEEGGAIEKALEKAFDEDFRRICRDVKNPYGEGDAARRIADRISSVEKYEMKKKFYDIEFKYDQDRWNHV